LLDDFKACSGYKIIGDFALRLEKETSDEAKNALKTLFFVLEEFIAAGFNELKPSGTNLGINMFKIDGFQVPEPVGKGRTVSFGFELFLLLIDIYITVIKSIFCLHIK